MLEQKLYTVADVAELTGLTSRTIRNYLKDGTLRGRKIGVQWRFTEEDIERLFSEVDAAGQKVLHPQDVILDFLRETEEEGLRGCLVLDIPCETEQMREYAEKIRECAGENEETLLFAWEEVEGHQVLRVAASGETGKLEEFAARMREIEKRRK